jgi:hypothetical protein
MILICIFPLLQFSSYSSTKQVCLAIALGLVFERFLVRLVVGTQAVVTDSFVVFLVSFKQFSG